MKQMELLSLPALLLLAATLAPATSHAAECSGTIGHVTAVSLDTTKYAYVNYSATGGQFDSDPLISATVSVPHPLAVVARPPPSCLIVHFSAEATALDNAIVFQVLLDGVPMQGNSPTGANGVSSPAIFEANPIIFHNDVEVGRPGPAPQMLSYTLFGTVNGGSHTVKVLKANCCSAINSLVPGSYVQAATLTVEYK